MGTWMISILCGFLGPRQKALWIGTSKGGDRHGLVRNILEKGADLQWPLQILGSPGALGKNGESSKPAAVLEGKRPHR